MDKTLAMKWVKDLRENGDKQGKGALCSRDEKYCCLGRLVEICNYPLSTNKFSSNLKTYQFSDSKSCSGTFEGKELKSKTGAFSKTVQWPDSLEWLEKKDSFVSLTRLNDFGIIFAQIADFIELNYEQF